MTSVSAETEGIHNAEAVLARCILFQALDAKGRIELAALTTRRRYATGEPIFYVDDPGESLMAVLSGVVRVSLPTKTGREVVLADIGPGELLGEIAMLDGGARSAAAVAHNKCELLVLERRAAVPFLRAHPEVCLKLLELVCGRVRKSDGRMLDLAFLEIPVRLAKVILATARPNAAGPARLSLSQSVLANMIGATRENVNRHIMDWQRQGIIERYKGWIVITKPESLALIANAS